MKKWLIGGVIFGSGASGIYTFAPQTEPAPAPGVQLVSASIATAPTSVEPAMLAQVVDVVDIDSLLEPPALPTSEGTGTHGPFLTAVGLDGAVPAPARQDTPKWSIPLAVE